MCGRRDTGTRQERIWDEGEEREEPVKRKRDEQSKKSPS